MVRFIRLLALVGLVVLIGVGPVRAQQNTDGSMYSRYGLGLMQSSLSSKAEAMGGSGTALLSPNYLSMTNPASWSTQILTRFIGGFRYQSVRSVDTENTASRRNAGSIGGASFSFPLLTQELGFLAAYSPVTRIGYEVRQSGTLPEDTLDSDLGEVGYETVFQGGGGLQSIKGGLGYRISRYVRVGANVDYMFGIIENSRRTEFAFDRYVNREHTQSTQLHGVTGTVGGIFLIPNVFSGSDYLSIGLSTRFPATLSGSRVTTLGETLDRDTVGVAQKGSMQIPARFQAGLAYQASDYVSIALDGLYAPWKDFSSDFSLPGYRADGTSTFTNRWQIGGGFEYRPAGRNANASYLERFMYRLGATIEQSYINPQPDIELMRYAVTGGLSMPTAAGGSRIDLNLEIGQRGSTASGLVKDTYYTGSIIVNFGERWFVKRPIQ